MALVSPIVQYFLDNNMCKPYADSEGDKSISVYLPFSANGNTQQAYYFASNTLLDAGNALITGIEVVDETTNSNIINPLIRDNFPVANLASAVLYVSNLNREIIATLPLVTLVRRLNLGKLTFTHFTEQVWQNCYVEFTDASVITSAVGLWFRVYYKDLSNG